LPHAEREAYIRRYALPIGLAAAAAIIVLAGIIIIIIRDRFGKEVARIPVPEGGSATLEQTEKAAQKPRPPPSSNRNTAGRTIRAR
jgi:hypothetical protein